MTLRAALDHFELPVGDADRAAGFFRDVFGWELRRVEEPGSSARYLRIAAGSGAISVGLLEDGGELLPNAIPVVRLEGESIEACLARVVERGGSVTLEATQIEGSGRFARFTDPDGHEWGLWAGPDLEG